MPEHDASCSQGPCFCLEPEQTSRSINGCESLQQRIALARSVLMEMVRLLQVPMRYDREWLLIRLLSGEAVNLTYPDTIVVRMEMDHGLVQTILEERLSEIVSTSAFALMEKLSSGESSASESECGSHETAIGKLTGGRTTV